jgi:hypothetical protein
LVETSVIKYEETGLISNWSELATLIEHHASGEWLFRGVTNIKHSLVPKIGRPEWRHAGFTDEVRPFSVKEEERLLRAFDKQARPYLGYLPRSDIEWMAIAQHHGLPTRLLDWTESLLVAAYFATEKAGTQGDAGIFAIHRFSTISEDDNVFTIKKPFTYNPPHISARIPAQRAVFTVHSSPSNALRQIGMKLWRIKSYCCLPIKRFLDTCAINRASLFPDLDGLSDNLGWRYKWRLI